MFLKRFQVLIMLGKCRDPLVQDYESQFLCSNKLNNQ